MLATCQTLVTLTMSMHIADPAKGYDSQASAWKSKLEAMKEAAKPAEKEATKGLCLFSKRWPWPCGVVRFDWRVDSRNLRKPKTGFDPIDRNPDLTPSI